jgi:gamma-glutamylcyclotransferase (GGCT)/AIG2-like uncharacterized protein YtfP
MRAARGRGETIVGDLYRVAKPRVFRVLDRYEAGSARAKARFVRVRCVVKPARGVSTTAWVYRYCRRVIGVARIPSGDYRVHRGSRVD